MRRNQATMHQNQCTKPRKRCAMRRRQEMEAPAGQIGAPSDRFRIGVGQIDNLSHCFRVAGGQVGAPSGLLRARCRTNWQFAPRGAFYLLLPDF